MFVNDILKKYIYGYSCGYKNDGVYQHFAVYIGNGRVIHYAAKNGDFGGCSIHEAPFEEFLLDSNEFEILNFDIERSTPARNGGILPFG